MKLIPFMNSKNYRLLAFLGVVLLIGGCKKKDPAPVICYLTDYTEVNGSYNYSEVLTYNDMNKVIMIAVTVAGSPTDVYTYTYGANGNLATANFPGGETVSYTFDGQNRLVLRTTAPSGETSTYSYNASGQNILRVYNDPSCASCGFTYTYTYPNTTTHNYSQLHYVSAGGSSFTLTFEYDDHPNPYKPVLYSSTGSDNNVTKQVFTDDAGTSSTTTITYTYNDKGYPLTAASSSGALSTYSYDCK
jgi:YD repeat-containing protein